MPKKSTPSPAATRILIVDDHPLVRRGLSELLGDEPDLEVCGEAADATEALRQIEATKPHVTIVDVSLEGSVNGIELIKRIKAKNESAKVLVSSMHEESLYAERAVRAGALGYINKHEATQKVIDAVHTVAAGNIYLSATMTERLLHRAVSGETPTPQSPVGRLSDRELEVFELIGAGMTTRKIAEQLRLSIKTIETYREHIKEKLDLANSSELNRTAVQWVIQKDGGT